MIYYIVGASFTGKTSFVRNTFITGKEVSFIEDTVPYYVNTAENYIVLGNYETTQRLGGTDRIPSEVTITEIADLIIAKANEGYDVVVEGFRMVNPISLNRILNNELDTHLVLIKSDLNALVRRSRRPMAIKQFKSMLQKSESFYRANEHKTLKADSIDTTDVEDFSTINLFDYIER